MDGYNWQEIRVQRSNYDQQVALERTAFNEGPQAVAGQTLTTEELPRRRRSRRASYGSETPPDTTPPRSD